MSIRDKVANWLFRHAPWDTRPGFARRMWKVAAPHPAQGFVESSQCFHTEAPAEISGEVQDYR